PPTPPAASVDWPFPLAPALESPLFPPLELAPPGLAPPGLAPAGTAAPFGWFELQALSAP
ncbi:MAG TPA: hypothetical protein VF294_04225, partial [Polyangiaceae bacterium]